MAAQADLLRAFGTTLHGIRHRYDYGTNFPPFGAWNGSHPAPRLAARPRREPGPPPREPRAGRGLRVAGGRGGPGAALAQERLDQARAPDRRGDARPGRVLAPHQPVPPDRTSTSLRPTIWQRRFDLRCPACGEELMQRLDSVERTQRIRTRYLTIAATGSVRGHRDRGAQCARPCAAIRDADRTIVFIAFLLSLSGHPDRLGGRGCSTTPSHCTDPTGTRRRSHWRSSGHRLSVV